MNQIPIHLLRYCYGWYRISCFQCGGRLKDMTTYKKICAECGFTSTRHLLVHNEDILSERSLLFFQYTLDKLWDDWRNIVKSYSDDGVFLKWRWSAFWWIRWIKKWTRGKYIENTDLYIFHKAQMAIPWEEFFNALVSYYDTQEQRKIQKNTYRAKWKEFNPEDTAQKKIISWLFQWYMEYGKLLVAWYLAIWEKFLEDFLLACDMATVEEALYIRDERYIEYEKIAPIIKRTLKTYPVLKSCLWYKKKTIIFN